MKTRTLIASLACQLFLLSYPVLGFQPPKESPERPVLVAPNPDFSPQGGFFGPIPLPPIVRYQNLPVRMHLEPYIPAPLTIHELDPRLVPLWERMLREGTDPELVEVAAFSLGRVAELALADIQSAEKSLLALARDSDNLRIRYAAGAALASGNLMSSAPVLISLAQSGNDAQRLRIEPALIRWKTSEALEMWKARISDPTTTNPSFRLAAEGLASINHVESADVLLSMTADPAISYSRRAVAASAAAALSKEKAFVAAAPLSTGDTQSRLLALALLDTEKPEAHEKAAEFCTDASDGVASVAWQQVFRRNSQLLQTHLETGRRHRDAMVRITAAKTMQLWANSERAQWLQELLSDVHIEVRNVARSMLVQVSGEHPELKDQIVRQAAAIVKPDSEDWQGMEQSLVLLAQLQATQFSQTALGVLGHRKDEVSIAAAWLIQLYPDEVIREQVRREIERCEAALAQGESFENDLALREKMLLQYAGLVRMKEIQPLMEQQFSKGAPGNADKRASALWALGVIHEKTADEGLAKRFEERIRDRASLPPEHLAVRRSSVLALGLLRSTKSIPVVIEAYQVDPKDAGIPDTARWVLPLLGEPMPPELPPFTLGVGGWRITPAD